MEGKRKLSSAVVSAQATSTWETRKAGSPMDCDSKAVAGKTNQDKRNLIVYTDTISLAIATDVKECILKNIYDTDKSEADMKFRGCKVINCPFSYSCDYKLSQIHYKGNGLESYCHTPFTLTRS